MLTIPFESGTAAYSFETPIDGVPYRFDVRWNTRSEAWHFDLYEQDGTPIAHGLKIVLGAFIGRRIQHRLFRTGVMVARDDSGQGRDATIDDLGTRVLVRWIPITEWFSRLDTSGVGKVEP